MALRHAILAALADREYSGYDLAKTFDLAVANFWSATPQQLYRELDKLAADGLVSGRIVEQQRRPNKRMFTITDRGRDELRAFTARPPKPTAVRDELLVQIEALEFGDADAIVASLAAKTAASQDRLNRYERTRDHLLGGRTEDEFLTGATPIGPYLTLLRGIEFERENLRWCAFAQTAIARRPKT